MTHAGATVNLNVSSLNLSLTSLDDNIVIASHDMPHISFASGGDCVSYTNKYMTVKGKSFFPITGHFRFCCICGKRCERLPCLLCIRMRRGSSQRRNSNNRASI